MEENEQTIIKSSTIPKSTSNFDQHDPRKLLAAEINDRDIQAAAASALAAASVKAKVNRNEYNNKNSSIIIDFSI